MPQYFIGATTWNIPRASAGHFPVAGSHLERYATVLNAVEINSSFYRQHKAETYARWAESVPGGFRFSVKLSKQLTHELKLNAQPSQIAEKLAPILALEQKLGALLVQLPPKLEFNSRTTARFFQRLRKRYGGAVVLEPRHPSWLSADAVSLLRSYDLHRVIADPDPFAKATAPGERKFSKIAYFRLHGSPVVYKSKYDPSQLHTFANWARLAVKQGCKTMWFIFDNSTFGHATADALEMRQLLGRA